MLAALLTLLSDGQFHSGEELGRMLGVSRAAVWKSLKRLEDDGYPLQRIRGKGYRAPMGASLLNLTDIQRALPLSLIKAVHWQLLDSVDSTNAQLMKHLASSHEPAVRVCLAEQQTSGKGRRGREWISPYAQNIYLSMAVPFFDGAQKLEGLSLLVGLVLVETLESFGFQGVSLKWPNDLLLNGRKLAGILVELAGDLTADCVAVIGVGVNVLMDASRPDIDQAWTSLLLARQPVSLDRNAIVGELIRRLWDAIVIFRETGFASFRESWEQRHAWQGQSVRVQTAGAAWAGKAMGVDERGALRLETEEGELLLHGGEVSLRLNNDS